MRLLLFAFFLSTTLFGQNIWRFERPSLYPFPANEYSSLLDINGSVYLNLNRLYVNQDEGCWILKLNAFRLVVDSVLLDSLAPHSGIEAIGSFIEPHQNQLRVTLGYRKGNRLYMDQMLLDTNFQALTYRSSSCFFDTPDNLQLHFTATAPSGEIFSAGIKMTSLIYFPIMLKADNQGDSLQYEEHLVVDSISLRNDRPRDLNYFPSSQSLLLTTNFPAFSFRFNAAINSGERKSFVPNSPLGDFLPIRSQVLGGNKFLSSGTFFDGSSVEVTFPSLAWLDLNGQVDTLFFWNPKPYHRAENTLLAQGDSSNIYLAAFYEFDGTVPSSLAHVVVQSVRANGHQNWQSDLGRKKNYKTHRSTMAQDGGLLLMNRFQNPSGSPTYELLKISAAGNFVGEEESTPISYGLSIYPNPAGEELHFSNPHPQPIQVTLTNLEGKSLLNFSLEPESENQSISVAHLARGLYLCEWTGNGQSGVQKVLLH